MQGNITGILLKPLIWLLIITGCNLPSFCQQLFLPLNLSANFHTDTILIRQDVPVHTGFKPLLLSDITPNVTYAGDTVKKKSRLYRKIKQESLIVINGYDSVKRQPAERGDYFLAADPLFHFEYGKDLADTSARADTTPLYRNTRGFLVRGDIGKNFSFETSFLESQAFFPGYLDRFVSSYGVVPGTGRTKPFKKGGYDYAIASGYISYTELSKRFKYNFSFGHGKHFIGDGYRSLLLSDNSFNYPFFRGALTKGFLQYTVLYGVFQNMIRLGSASGTEGIFQKKIINVHYLSMDLGKAVQLGFYESLLSLAADSLGRMKNDFFSFNPLIGINTIRYGFVSPENILAGMTFKVKISNHVHFYGQVALDDLKKSKHGLQGGVKIFNPFNIDRLVLFSEINYVTPYSFAHSDSLQAYTHYNQPLAHPLGADFVESVSMAYYRFMDFFISARMNFAKYDEDSGRYHYGKNIFRSDNSMTPFSTRFPGKTALVYQNLEAGYLFNPSTNLQFAGGITLRSENGTPVNTKTKYIYFVLRTSLFNSYTDF